MICGETINQRALACAWCASNASKIRLARMRKKLPQQFFRLCRMILDGRDRARDGAHVASTDLVGQVVHGRDHCGSNLYEWKVSNENIPLADYLNSQNRSSQARDDANFVAHPFRGEGFHRAGRIAI